MEVERLRNEGVGKTTSNFYSFGVLYRLLQVDIFIIIKICKIKYIRYIKIKIYSLGLGDSLAIYNISGTVFDLIYNLSN